jgi:hypothetical protein
LSESIERDHVLNLRLDTIESQGLSGALLPDLERGYDRVALSIVIYLSLPHAIHEEDITTSELRVMIREAAQLDSSGADTTPPNHL